MKLPNLTKAEKTRIDMLLRSVMPKSYKCFRQRFRRAVVVLEQHQGPGAVEWLTSLGRFPKPSARKVLSDALAFARTAAGKKGASQARYRRRRDPLTGQFKAP